MVAVQKGKLFPYRTLPSFHHLHGNLPIKQGKFSIHLYNMLMNTMSSSCTVLHNHNRRDNIRRGSLHSKRKWGSNYSSINKP